MLLNSATGFSAFDIRCEINSNFAEKKNEWQKVSRTSDDGKSGLWFKAEKEPPVEEQPPTRSARDYRSLDSATLEYAIHQEQIECGHDSKSEKKTPQTLYSPPPSPPRRSSLPPATPSVKDAHTMMAPKLPRITCYLLSFTKQYNSA